MKFDVPRHYLPLGTTVAPGKQYTFAFTMKAPTTTGTYSTGYQMVWEGHQWFGDLNSATINVS